MYRVLLPVLLSSVIVSRLQSHGRQIEDLHGFILFSQANKTALMAHLVNKALKCLPDLFLCWPALKKRLHLASQRKAPYCFSVKGPSLSMREVWRRLGVIFHCFHMLCRLPNTQQSHSPPSTCLNDTPKRGSLK